MTFSPKSEILSDATVREAVALSIDRTRSCRSSTKGTPTRPHVFPGSIPQGGKENPIVSRNVDAARRKLEAAGWKASGDGWSKDGATLSVELMVSEEALPGSRRLAELIHGQLTETGFDVSVASVDSATIHDRRQEFAYDLTFMGTYGAPYDPHGTIANLLLSSVDSGPTARSSCTPIWIRSSRQDWPRPRRIGKRGCRPSTTGCPITARSFRSSFRSGSGRTTRGWQLLDPLDAYDMPVEGVVVNE